MSRYHFKARQQRGAALFIALILLLIITALAISSMRESTLEARITANTIESKRLFNSAEAGLREGERRIALSVSPLDSCGSVPCIKGVATTYTTDFSTAHAYSGVDGATAMSRNVHWYIRDTGAGAAESQAIDPTYGAASGSRSGGGVTTRYYEINSQAYNSSASAAAASCTIDVICLRSVVVRLYTD